MLDCEILKTEYAVSYGSVTLKSLQNENVPELDLLVREAIQNSSDASLSEYGKFFVVRFFTGGFEPKRLNAYMTKLETKLNKKFSGNKESFLEIRDTNTSGLTGCIKKEEIKRDDHGNFFKLIYDTGKKQTNENAGGNWGFGKSVYYRVGIGIVIFYSRIKTENGFESRLIITLIEDENKKDEYGNDITLLNSVEELSAGKAWWGIRDNDDLLPLTDEKIIKTILEVFGLNPFEDNETGTSVIIPYINPQMLLDGIISPEADIRHDVKENLEDTWLSSIENYLKLSIQRWYAPKIHNREINKFSDKKWLNVSVNNVPIRKQDLLPFFNLTQELYTTALAKVYCSSYESKDYPGIELLPINIMSYFSKSNLTGYLAFIRIKEEELNKGNQYLTPYDYIGKFEADGGLNEPIVMYARDPGMVIDYAITGPWVKNISPPENNNEYIFAFFVPNSENTIRADLKEKKYAGKKLGEYLRECEASDHMNWDDPATMQIVQRIQKNTINQIKKKTNEIQMSGFDSTASKLSKKLGINLLPRLVKNKSTGGSGGSGSGGGTKIRSVDFALESPVINKNEIEFYFTLKMSQGIKNVILSLMIASEGGWIDAEAWEKEIGTVFPISLEELYIDFLKPNESKEPYLVKYGCTSLNPDYSDDILEFSINSETVKNTKTKIVIIPHVLNPEIVGKIKLKTKDKKYQFSFKVE